MEVWEGNPYCATSPMQKKHQKPAVKQQYCPQWHKEWVSRTARGGILALRAHCARTARYF